MLLPQVLREVDRKKHDGRLGKHARAFNRLCLPAAESGNAHRVRANAPAVDIILGRCRPIPWEQYDDLDQAEGDCKVIAETLNLVDMPRGKPVFVSADIYPIGMASRYGLPTHHAGDDWLRQPEPSPEQKRVQRLQERVRTLEAKEPTLELELEVNSSLPLRIYNVEQMSTDEQDAFVSSVLERNPSVPQSLRSTFERFDFGYEQRYAEYETKTVPEFAQNLHALLELLFSQVPISLEVRNVGVIQAEGLVVELHTSGGWLHDKFVYESTRAPIAPRPRGLGDERLEVPNLAMPHFAHPSGRHEIVLDPAPNRGPSITAQCRDFRHGSRWCFEGVLHLDPHDTNEPVISVRATAANMRGETIITRQIGRTIKRIRVADVLELTTGNLLEPLPMKPVLDEASRDGRFDRFERLSDFE